MSADDDLRTGLSILLENFPSEVTLPKQDKRETIMHMAMRLDPSFKPTASTLRARERQAEQVIIRIFKERDAMTSKTQVLDAPRPSPSPLLPRK